MKRRDLVRHLTANGCVLLGEIARYSWWINVLQNRRVAIPRHSEVNHKRY